MSYDLLDGVRVVELSMYAFAPSAAAVLADWGADVTKVVPASHADPMRGTPVAGLPDVDVGVAFMWEITNRGKRCIALDVSVEEGRAVLLELIARADVFITNFPFPVRERLGLRSEDLLHLNERLIYASLSPYGEQGPERDRTGFDTTAWWARSGLMDMVRPTNDAEPALKEAIELVQKNVEGLGQTRRIGDALTLLGCQHRQN